MCSQFKQKKNTPGGNKTFAHMSTYTTTHLIVLDYVCVSIWLKNKNTKHSNVNKKCETMQRKAELALLCTTLKHTRRKISSKIKWVLEREISSNRRQTNVGAMV